jgi:hydroxymethylglutaryl-CoA reductase
MLRAMKDELNLAFLGLCAREFRHCTMAAVHTPRFVAIPSSVDTNWKPDTQIVVDIGIGTADVMGANIVTRLAELFADEVLDPAVGQRRLAAICTNESAGCDAQAHAVFRLPSRAHRDRFLDLHRLAQHDRKRVFTHNKGVMNAVTALALATGQDTRAIEAAVRSGPDDGLLPFTRYYPIDDAHITGSIRLKLPVGSVGGATTGPAAKKNLRTMEVTSGRDLAQLMAVAGLAQNFAALLSLTNEGITDAHRRMRRSKRNRVPT